MFPRVLILSGPGHHLHRDVRPAVHILGEPPGREGYHLPGWRPVRQVS